MNTRTVSGSKQGGFVLTIELILISTILVIGSFSGLVLIRDALIKQKSAISDQQMVVSDANGTILGRVIGFDKHEAPKVPLIDRSLQESTGNAYRALLSIRDDRFTSREAVYYSGANCTGTPCVKAPSDEDTDSTGISGVRSTGVTSYLYALQGSPVYAVGDDPFSVKGHLYRGSSDSCPVAPSEIASRYVSQKVVSGKPCESVEFADETEANIQCIADVGQACNCPTGYYDQGDIIERYLEPIDTLLASTLDPLVVLGLSTEVTVGEICCPEGTQLEDDGNLVNSVVYAVVFQILNTSDDLSPAVSAQLRKVVRKLYEPLRCVSNVKFNMAEAVNSPNDEEENVLSDFQAPFRISLPATSTQNGDQWISRPTSDIEGF